MQEVELTWADKLMEKGLEKGRAEGRETGVVEGLRRTLLRLLTAKFGELPQESKARIEALPAADLDSLLDRVLTAGTLNELGLSG